MSKIHKDLKSFVSATVVHMLSPGDSTTPKPGPCLCLAHSTPGTRFMKVPVRERSPWAGYHVQALSHHPHPSKRLVPLHMRKPRSS